MATGKQDLFEVIDFIAALSNLLGDLLEDGRITLGEIISHTGEIMALPGLALTAWHGRETITWDQIKEREDRDELLAYFKNKLDLPDDLAEEKIEEGFSAALAFIGFVFTLNKSR